MKTITINNEIAYEYKHNTNYYITKTGILYSIYQKGRRGIIDINNPHRVVYGTDKDGYFRVVLSKHGKLTYIKIHKIVVEQFIGEIIPPLVVNHIDGNKQNNNVNNLEIVTVRENTIHAIKTGLKNPYNHTSYINVNVEYVGKIYNFPSMTSCCNYFKDLSLVYVRHIFNNEMNFNLLMFKKINPEQTYSKIEMYYNGTLHKIFNNLKEASVYIGKPRNSISGSYHSKYSKKVNKYIITFPSVSTIENTSIDLLGSE